MQVTCGTDIIEIDRIKESIETLQVSAMFFNTAKDGFLTPVSYAESVADEIPIIFENSVWFTFKRFRKSFSLVPSISNSPIFSPPFILLISIL